MSQTFNWCFTINNYTAEETADLESWLTKGVTYIAYGKELGEKKTPHLQGFLHCQKKQRLSFCKGLNAKAHWEPMRGSLLQNEKYCSKQSELIELGKKDGWSYNRFAVTSVKGVTCSLN